jgi:hypothetical protein
MLGMFAAVALSDSGRATEGGKRMMSDAFREQAQVPYNPTDGELGEIERVLRRHQAALLARPGVTGVAVGRSSIGDPAIVIYLLDKKHGAGLPATLDGHPVVTEVTGPIDALGR